MIETIVMVIAVLLLIGSLIEVNLWGILLWGLVLLAVMM